MKPQFTIRDLCWLFIVSSVIGALIAARMEMNDLRASMHALHNHHDATIEVLARRLGYHDKRFQKADELLIQHGYDPLSE